MSQTIKEGARGPLLASGTISTAVTAVGTTPVTMLGGMKYLAVQAKFVRAGGGTTAKAYVQTSLDGGVTWIDIMCFAFTTSSATKMSTVKANIATSPAIAPTDGSLTDDTILDGVLGDRIRTKWVTTGTYTGATSLNLDFVAKA